MSFTLYVVLHGLVALFPGEDQTRTVLLPDAYTEYNSDPDHCDLHEGRLHLIKGDCKSGSCSDIAPLLNATIDLNLPPLTGKDRAVDASEMRYVWPLKGDLGLSLDPEAKLSAQTRFEGGVLRTCAVQEFEDATPNPYSPEYTLRYPSGSAKNTRVSILAELVAWEREIPGDRLVVTTSDGNTEVEWEIEPEPCGFVGKDCIVLALLNPAVNANEWDCRKNADTNAEHFREYLSLFKLPRDRFPKIPAFMTKVHDYQASCEVSGLQELQALRHRQFHAPLLELFAPIVITIPSHRASCPIVQ
jgi:hypothetical protein